MAKKIVLIVSIFAGLALGGFGAWTFHYILDGNEAFITGQRVLASIVGAAGLLFSAHIAYSLKTEKPRSYGLFVLGIACGIFLQAIA